MKQFCSFRCPTLNTTDLNVSWTKWDIYWSHYMLKETVKDISCIYKQNNQLLPNIFLRMSIVYNVCYQGFVSLSASNTYFDFLLNIVVKQDVRVNAVVRLRQWEGVEGSALCGLLLGLLVPSLFSFQEDSLERRHDPRLLKTHNES